LPRVRTSDIPLRYEEAGRGQPVLLIMGLAGSLEWWGPEIRDALARRFRVIVFDNRGAGLSDRPPGPYSIAQMADDTVGLMDALKIPHAHIVGYSMGGMIAQEVALRHPKRVDRLLLAATSPGGILSAPPKLRALRVFRQGRDPDQAREVLLTTLFPRAFIESHREWTQKLSQDLARHQTDEASARRQFWAILRWSAWRRLPQIQAPTVVAHGTDDILLPVRNAYILTRRIPRSRLRLFPGGGHGFGLQFPGEVAGEIDSFLR